MEASSKSDRPTIICLTPIKNESWILDRFLQCASLWADHIIIADQNSTDGSREIALCYPKVKLIENPLLTFNELEMRKPLIEAARKISQRSLLISLDADECLTSNFIDSPEWKTILSAAPGTVIHFNRANLMADVQSYWIEGEGENYPFGFMDDGSDYAAEKIHGKRVPIPINASMIYLRDIKVLHYQFTDWERMQSKHRWYQCWERLNRSSRRPIEVYRQYHHMDSLAQSQIQPLPKSWLHDYETKGIDMTSIHREAVFWWDREVLDWFSKYGAKVFRREAVWDIDWSEIATKIGDNSETNYADPRNRLDRLVHRWLKETQLKAPQLQVRLIQRILGLFGW